MDSGLLPDRARLHDEHTGAAYTPTSYPGHGSGLFFVGLEANGTIYAYALNQSGGYTRVATITSGFVGVMEVQFDQETQALWAVCDDNCDGRTETLRIAQTGQDAGRFVVDQVYARPSGMPNLNNEGFVMAPQAECVDGRKPVFWSDDSNDDGHALRAGTVDCTVLSEPGGGDPAAAGDADAAARLAETGSSPGGVLGWALGATAAGIALLGLAVLRRRRSS